MNVCLFTLTETAPNYRIIALILVLAGIMLFAISQGFEESEKMTGPKGRLMLTLWTVVPFWVTSLAIVATDYVDPMIPNMSKPPECQWGVTAGISHASLFLLGLTTLWLLVEIPQIIKYIREIRLMKELR